MKKIIITAFIFASLLSIGQVPSDDSLKSYTDTYIIPNASNAITATMLNTILNDIIIAKVHKDSAFHIIYNANDSIIYTYYGENDTIVLNDAYWLPSGENIYNANSGYVSIISPTLGKLGIGSAGFAPSQAVVVRGSVSVDSNLYVVRVEEQEPDHADFTFAATGADTIGGASAGVDIVMGARWVWVPFVWGGNWTDTDSDGFTLLSGDTVRYDGTNNAHIRIEITLGITGTNAEDYEIAIMNVTDDRNVPIPTRTPKTLGGTTNYQDVTIKAYDTKANTNDKYLLKIRDLTSNKDVLFFYGSMFFKVIHY